MPANGWWNLGPFQTAARDTVVAIGSIAFVFLLARWFGSDNALAHEGRNNVQTEFDRIVGTGGVG